MAKKIETRVRGSGGSEAMLDGAAINVLFLGLVLTVTLVALSQFGGWIPASIIFFMTVIAFYSFRALADIIRLLKETAGIPYSGTIASGPLRSEFKCSDCNAILRSGLKCDSCGAEIDYN